MARPSIGAGHRSVTRCHSRARIPPALPLRHEPCRILCCNVDFVDRTEWQYIPNLRVTPQGDNMATSPVRWTEAEMQAVAVEGVRLQHAGQTATSLAAAFEAAQKVLPKNRRR
jgi:hypothetical protein